MERMNIRVLASALIAALVVHLPILRAAGPPTSAPTTSASSGRWVEGYVQSLQSLSNGKPRLVLDRRGEAAELDLSGVKVDDGVVARVAGLASLKRLVFDDYSPGVSMAPLARLSRLQTLELRGYDLAKDTLEWLPELTHLWRLHLTEAKGVKLGLANIARAKSFQYLRLDQTDVADADLNPLKGHPSLVWLDLTLTAVTDRAIDTIESIPELRVLNLNRTDVTQDRLVRLQRDRQRLSVFADDKL